MRVGCGDIYRTANDLGITKLMGASQSRRTQPRPRPPVWPIDKGAAQAATRQGVFAWLRPPSGALFTCVQGEPSAGLETCATAGLEACATGAGSKCTVRTALQSQHAGSRQTLFSYGTPGNPPGCTQSPGLNTGERARTGNSQDPACSVSCLKTVWFDAHRICSSRRAPCACARVLFTRGVGIFGQHGGGGIGPR